MRPAFDALTLRAMTSIETPRAFPHLWPELQTLLRQIFTLFGEPQQIAFQHTLTARAHKLLCAWLRAAEALMRQLLLIEAASLCGAGALVGNESAERAREGAGGA